MAENKNTKITQIFIKSIDNKTLTLILPPIQTLTCQSIKSRIQTLLQFPIQSQTLTLNGRILSDSTPITPDSINFQTLTLNCPLRGGKGGFGSLLRGAATKAGQKKTNNFDACRDMSGRRLRHVNAEKRLEEWRLEEEERKLEKKAEEYLKKVEKGGKSGRRDDGAEKYVEKYRADSAKCVEEVEDAVKELKDFLLKNGKKRMKEKSGGDIDGSSVKKLKIWMGKRKIGESESDSDDFSDDENDESDVENEKPSIINNGNHSDTSKDGSSGSPSVLESDVDYQSGGPSGNGSEEEKETVTGGSSGSDGTPIGSNAPIIGNDALDTSSDASDIEGKELSNGATLGQASGQPVDSSVNGFADQLHTTSVTEKEVSQVATAASEGHNEGVNGSSSNGTDVLQALNFDDFNSATELEALGLERLKCELQSRGLKCGGTLQERAARLFLLKTTPIDKLPKKLLAKK